MSTQQSKSACREGLLQLLGMKNAVEELAVIMTSGGGRQSEKHIGTALCRLTRFYWIITPWIQKRAKHLHFQSLEFNKGKRHINTYTIIHGDTRNRLEG